MKKLLLSFSFPVFLILHIVVKVVFPDMFSFEPTRKGNPVLMGQIPENHVLNAGTTFTVPETSVLPATEQFSGEALVYLANSSRLFE